MSVDQARATIEIGATTAQLATGLRRATGMVQAFARGTSSLMTKKFGGKGSLAGAGMGALGGFAAGAAMRGLDILADQGKAVMDFEKNLTRLGIAGGLSTQKLDEVRRAARGASSAFGIGADQILAGTQTYVDLTGDVDGATKSMETFARIAQASGASVSDVAEASAAFKGIGVPLEEMEARFGGLITQGKKGAVSLKDFAGELAGLAPRWAKFNESTTDSGIAQLGAAFQVARQGFGSASEAATGMSALMGALTQNAKKFEAAGVQIFDKNPKTGVKTLRTFEQIMSAIEKSRLIKDPTLMTKAMGSKEAEQTATMLLRARREVTATGNAYQDLVNAGADAGAVQRDLTTYLESSAGKMDKAWEMVKNKLAEVFTPERIDKFANALGKAVDMLAKIVGYAEKVGKFVDNVVNDVENKATGDVDKMIEKARAKGPEEMKREADALLQTMAYHDQKGHKGGVAGRYQDAFDERVREKAFALRDEAEQQLRVKNDPWNQAKTQLEPLLMSDNPTHRQAAGNVVMQQFQVAIVDAIKEGLATHEIRIGDNQIAKSKSKATSRRTRP